jgi:hypothetical protein
VESAQRDGVQGEEVGGRQSSGVSVEESSPAGVCSVWCWAEAGSRQDSADRRGAQAMSQPGEFSLDAAVAPGRILLCQAQHQVPNLVTDRWAGLAGWDRSTFS